jgi:hypothetical protein
MDELEGVMRRPNHRIPDRQGEHIQAGGVQSDPNGVVLGRASWICKRSVSGIIDPGVLESKQLRNASVLILIRSSVRERSTEIWISASWRWQGHAGVTCRVILRMCCRDKWRIPDRDG